MQKDDLLQSALTYLEKYGFSVIPVRPDKKPFIKWEEFQKRKATPEEVQGWFTQWPNVMIGIVTGTISGLCVIDIDAQEGKEALQEFIPDSLIMPTSQTPRGGRHLYFKAPQKPLSNKTGIPKGCDFRGEGGFVIAPPSVNGIGKAYRWLVDLNEAPLPALPEPYILFINNNAFGGYKGGDVNDGVNDPERLQVTPSDVKMFVEGRRDNDLFHIANCLIKGGAKENETLQVLEILALNCEPPFPLKEIPEKLKSALKRAQKKEWNISEEVREFVVTSFDAFLTSDVYQRLQVTSREEKKAVVKALLRLHEEGIIERCGGRNGCYRRVEFECEEINWYRAGDTIFAIQFPFAIEKFVTLLPKNIVILAGVPNAGKTAFLLNTIRLNMYQHKVFYFSSEMGDLELKKRLSKFDLPLDQWSFVAKERSSNFADVIRPDDLNIIDFLELYDEFYKIGFYIKEIYDKLRNGIAIISIQKNPNTDYGLGGMRGLEKARLYLTMESEKIKIVKAKNWATEINPVGLELDFKLAQGCKFIVQKDWYRP